MLEVVMRERDYPGPHFGQFSWASFGFGSQIEILAQMECCLLKGVEWVLADLFFD